MKPTPQPARAYRSKTFAYPVAAALLAMTVVPVARAGSLYAFGLNQFGQIGDGTAGTSADPTLNSKFSPVPVIGLTTGVTAFATGGHSMAVKNGALYTWGFNAFGQLGQGTGGSGTATDYTTTPAPALVLTSGVTQVAGGLYHSVVVANGGVYTFGLNSNGVLGTGAANNAIVTTPMPVTALSSGVTTISSSQQHVLAVKNGAVYAWGANNGGQLGTGVYGSSTNQFAPVAVGGMDSGVTVVGAGSLHSLAIKNGAAYAWGYNNYGQLGTGGATSGTAAINPTPLAIPTLSSGVTDISAGSNHSLALKNGVVYAWGRNDVGQLGDGSGSNSTVPLAVTGITDPIADIEAGNTSSYALAVDGSLWSWGANTYGQLGIGVDDTPLRTPQHTFAAVGYRFTDIEAAPSASHVLITVSALPVYFKGTAGNNLTDVANYATSVAGTTAAPIAPVESTDIYFGTSNATVANLNTSTGAGLVANTLTFGTGASATSAVTIGGSGSITLYADKNSYAAGTGIVVQSGSAAVTINAPINLGGNQSWTNQSATPLAINGAVNLGASNLTLAGTNGTALSGVVSGSGALSVTAGGTTTLSAANTYTGGTTVNNAAATVRVSPAAATVLLSGSGTNVANGRVAFQNADTGTLGTVRSLLTSGYASGFATGTLRSSTATASRGLGYKFDGTTVTVMATLYGDANLDGNVDFNDFLVLQNNFAKPDTRFDQGNFNYDNLTDFNDFLVLQNNFGKSVNGSAVAFTSEQVAAITAFGASVPEPTLMAVAGLGLAAGLRRTRRASK